MPESTAPPIEHAIITLELSSVKELASAQQQMYELVVTRVRMIRANFCTSNVHEEESDFFSEEDHWGTLSFPVPIPQYLMDAESNDEDLTIFPPDPLVDILSALRHGNNKLIVRKWKRGASWWNFNTDRDGDRWISCFISRGNGIDNRVSDHTPQWNEINPLTIEELEVNFTALKMAYTEVAGYRLARRALRDCGDRVYVAQVLYFSHDDKYPEHCPPELNLRPRSNNKQEEKSAIHRDDEVFIEPWAILSHFDHGTPQKPEDDRIQLTRDFNFDLVLEPSQPTEAYEFEPCHHYPTTMTKVRHEFGFDEPHPRHGRVPEDECLEYAKMVLRDVVIPIHRYFFFLSADTWNCQDKSFSNDCLRDELPSLGWFLFGAPGAARILGFGLVPSGKRIYHNNTMLVRQPFQFLDMTATYRLALRGISHSLSYNTNDGRTMSLTEMLTKCVDALHEEWVECRNIWSALPPVLCHLDLQPQNLAFHHDTDELDCSYTEHRTARCHVAAVMDWEEACYADPRFELMLLCRKVLANRAQADAVWNLYSKQVQLWRDEFRSRYNGEVDWDVGPIEPWLKLECVHSLFILIFQLLDGHGGGRNPWETKTDLLGKIDRERQRLVIMGWSFCDINIVNE